MSDRNIPGLLYNYLQETLTEAERKTLEEWARSSVNNARLMEEISDPGMLSEALAAYHLDNKEALRKKILETVMLKRQESSPLNNEGIEPKLSRPAVLRLSKTRVWAVAASVLVALAIGGYVWTIDKKEPAAVPAVVKTAEIQPGKEGAVLTLADGTRLVLDSFKNGAIALQNGSQAIIKNGQLMYDVMEAASGEVAYNTVNTPKGRQFKLILPDGTAVWLNAASSIRYPTVFNGKERKVQITGEAYFEVVKNAGKPFRVIVNDKAEVEVLGTRFNLSAYENDNIISTTLLEGSVKMNGALLKPGQQGQLNQADGNRPGAVKVLNEADLDKAIAWKNGLFNFEGMPLADVMKQLERWYDIQVEYEKEVPDIKFWGEMSKDVSLNGLLIVLKKSEMHFRLEGRKLIVLP